MTSPMSSGLWFTSTGANTLPSTPSSKMHSDSSSVCSSSWPYSETSVSSTYSWELSDSGHQWDTHLLRKIYHQPISDLRYIFSQTSSLSTWPFLTSACTQPKPSPYSSTPSTHPPGCMEPWDAKVWPQIWFSYCLQLFAQNRIVDLAGGKNQLSLMTNIDFVCSSLSN